MRSIQTSSRKVLVLGGAGYVGSHTCKVLARSGFEPIVFDDLSTGHRSFVRWGGLIEGDIRRKSDLEKAFRGHEFAAVMHFAARANVAESVIDPERYFDNNVVGSLSLLGAMREAGWPPIVFSSTCAVYGQPTQMPISEEAVVAPINPYGVSKLMIERVLADYYAAYGARYITLRYFNACGADPDGEIGELRDPETHLIPRAMMAIQGHVSDFEIFGDDFETPDGTAIRDYIHVMDLANAHVLALRALLSGQRARTYNLGSGVGFSVKQIVREIERVSQAHVSSPQGSRRLGDPPVLVADSMLAKTELGWSPSMSTLTTIIETAWRWHQKAHPRLNCGPTFI